MGYSSSTPDDYRARSAFRSSIPTGTVGSTMYHSMATASMPFADRKIHETLDPKKLNTKGEKIRECLDSTEHPETIAAFVGFDETGSMGGVPMQLQAKLALLKGATLRAGLEHLQIAFGAYGDAQNGEVAPCQVGQFEGGVETEEWLNNLYLEGNGGGNHGETAGLLLYYLAHHSRLDSLDKRGKKGYLILTGDEVPLRTITRAEVKTYLDDDIQADVSIEQVVEDVTNTYEVYFFMIDNAASVSQDSLKVWSKLLGSDHVVTVQNVDTIAEQIALLIGQLEGAFASVDDGVAALAAEGADPDAVRRAGRELATVGAGTSRSPAVAEVTGDIPSIAASGSVERL